MILTSRESIFNIFYYGGVISYIKRIFVSLSVCSCVFLSPIFKINTQNFSLIWKKSVVVVTISCILHFSMFWQRFLYFDLLVAEGPLEGPQPSAGAGGRVAVGHLNLLIIWKTIKLSLKRAKCRYKFFGGGRVCFLKLGGTYLIKSIYTCTGHLPLSGYGLPPLMNSEYHQKRKKIRNKFSRRGGFFSKFLGHL